MKRWLFGSLAFILVGCAAHQSTPQATAEVESIMLKNASLPDLGPAPELTNTTWPNVEAPLRIADLRGKVVAIDMWTFG